MSDTWCDSPAEPKYATATAAIEELKACGFMCEAGPLENSEAFRSVAQWAAELDASARTLEQLKEERVEYGFGMAFDLLDEQPSKAIFFERANCAWAEQEVVVGKVTGPGVDEPLMALFDFDGNFIRYWVPNQSDLFAQDWRIADLERNKSWKAYFDELKATQSIKIGAPVTYFDHAGQPYIGAVSKIWTPTCINILLESGDAAPTSIPFYVPGMSGLYFVRGHKQVENGDNVIFIDAEGVEQHDAIVMDVWPNGVATLRVDGCKTVSGVEEYIGQEGSIGYKRI